MNATPTLDPERTAQLRTFLVTEAAADAASTSTSPARRPRHLRLAVGVTAAVLLAGSLTVASGLTGTGSEPADAVAIEQADGWTTVRLIDVDADPQAVVDELRAAGIEARVGDADEVGTSATGATGVTGLSAESTDGSVGVGMLSAVPLSGAPGDGSPGAGATSDAAVGDAEPIEVDGATGVIGETETVPAGTPTEPSTGEAIELPAEQAEALDRQLEDAGIRFGDGGEISIRNGADVRVVVYRG